MKLRHQGRLIASSACRLALAAAKGWYPSLAKLVSRTLALWRPGAPRPLKPIQNQPKFIRMSSARSLRRRIFLCLAALPCFAALLCPALLPAQEYRFEYLGANQGLTNLAVRNIYQDRQGYLWISTENGVFRYDGERFLSYEKNEGLPTSSGVAFGEAPDGTLLVGGNIGLFRLAGNRFEPIPLPGAKSVSWAGGIRSDSLGRTFIATNNGLMLLTAAAGQFSIRPIPTADGVSDPSTRGLWVESQTAWYGCGLQLCSFNDGHVTVFGTQSGLVSALWTVIGRDKSGALWVRGRAVGVVLLLPGASRFQLVEDSPLPRAGVTGIPAVDSDGDLLFPASNGLVVHNSSGWHTVGTAQGLHGTVYSVLQDREGSVWIGLAGRGLVRWAGYKLFESFTSQSGLSSDLVYQILPDEDGSVWVGTESGLSHGVLHKATYAWDQISAFANVPVHAIQRGHSGALWLGTETLGVAHFDPITHRVTWFGANRGIENNNVSSLMFDRAARLWIATESGLYILAPPYNRASAVTVLPRTQFWAIAESPSGEIWAGGAGGLFRLSKGSWRHFSTKDDLTHDEILALAASSAGDIWVGYRFGGEIDQVASSSSGLHVTHVLTQRDRATRLTYFLGFDQNARLWAGTEHGVDVFDGNYWAHIDSNDGLVWDDCDLNGFAAGPGRSIWIGTSGGLVRYKPPDKAAPVFPSSVVLTRILLGGRPIVASDRPAVPYRSNQLIVQFSDLTFTHGPNRAFRYRLTPLFDEWRSTDRRELEFPSLPPGSYRLEIQVRDRLGAWSSNEASFSFVVRPPWFQTWWFTSLLILALVAAFFTFQRIRTLVARAREHELTQIVAERTRALENANAELSRLSSIDWLTGIANRRTFDHVLTREFARLPRSDAFLSLLLIDVDHFKILNDTRGHLFGDDCLALIAGALRERARRGNDLVARYGGEEFAIVLPGLAPPEALEFAESVRLRIIDLKIPAAHSPTLPVLTVSIGVGTVTARDQLRLAEFLSSVDQALYAAKADGRNCVHTARSPFAHSSFNAPLALDPTRSN